MYSSLAGKSLGKYQLRELMGMGFMGAVYRAYDQTLGREVAIKVVNDTVGRADFHTRFTREAKTAASLEHGHIVHIYEYGVDNGVNYVVMQYLTGGSLSQRMRQADALGIPLPSLIEVSRLLNQLASALDYAHQQGILHRDIKPPNVMLNSRGEGFIVDFGIAKLMSSTTNLTNTNVTMGTPNYMPPEQWTKAELLPTTDQYALGVSIYQLLAGYPPFEADTLPMLWYKIQHEQAIPLHKIRPDIPAEITAVVSRAMAKVPKDRYPTCADFAEAFQIAASDTMGVETGYFTFKLLPTPPIIPHLPGITNTLFIAPEPEKTPSAIVSKSVASPIIAPKSRRRVRLAWVVTVMVLITSVFAARNWMSRQIPPVFGASENPTLQPVAFVNLPKVFATETITLSITPTDMPSPTATVTATASPTETASATSTLSPTLTPSNSPTPPPTYTPSLSPRQAALATVMATIATATPTYDYQLEVEAQITAIHLDFLTATATIWTITPSQQPSATLTPSPTATPSPVLLRVVRPANLREGPGTNYQIVGGADADTEFEVIARWRQWYLINWDENRQAWISNILIELPDPTPEIELAITVPPSPVPTNTPTFTPSPTITETPTQVIFPPETTQRP